MPLVRVDTDYLIFFGKRSQVRRDFEAVNRLLAGAVPIYVVIDGGQPGALREPEALRAIERLERAVETIPGVTHAASIVDLLRALNRAVEAGDPAQERIPDTRGGCRRAAPADSQGRRSAPAHHGPRAREPGGADGDGGLGGGPRAPARSSRHRGRRAADPLTASVTGNAILLSRSADGIAGGQLSSVCLAAGSIFLLVLAGLRSIPPRR